jgi:hypothetical protein
MMAIAAEQLEVMRGALMNLADVIGRALLPAFRQMATASQRLLWAWTSDYVSTGKEPYGGIWSRWMLRGDR